MLTADAAQGGPALPRAAAGARGDGEIRQSAVSRAPHSLVPRSWTSPASLFHLFIVPRHTYVRTRLRAETQSRYGRMAQPGLLSPDSVAGGMNSRRVFVLPVLGAGSPGLRRWQDGVPRGLFRACRRPALTVPSHGPCALCVCVQKGSSGISSSEATSPITAKAPFYDPLSP